MLTMTLCLRVNCFTLCPMASIAYKRVGLTVKSDLHHRDEVAAEIVGMLRASGAEVLIDERRAECFASHPEVRTFTKACDVDLLLVIGGDGTILRAVRELDCFSVPILSVNRGTVGFMAEMNVDEAVSLLPRFLAGEGVVEERSALTVTAKRGEKTLYEGFVLNEAVIAQGSIARLIDLKTSINGEELTVFRADGLIIATPTGSTAYTLAAGGPIVHPEIAASILTPINSHTFNQKPVVIPGTHRVQVEVLNKKGGKFGAAQVSLTLDGQTYVALERKDVVTASVRPERVRFLRRSSETFYGTLRQKLKWGERPED